MTGCHVVKNFQAETRTHRRAAFGELLMSFQVVFVKQFCCQQRLEIPDRADEM